MAEVGGYNLHIYCDHPKCSDPTKKFPEWRPRSVGEFGGNNLQEARREARRAGWRIDRTLPVGEGIPPAWICPLCRKEKNNALP